MALLKQYGIGVPRGDVANSVDQVTKIASDLGGECVIKAQVLAGGRGKGHFVGNERGPGGVQIAKSIDDAQRIGRSMLGQVLVTKQTGERGRPCNSVFVVEPIRGGKELYLALLLDRESQGFLLVGSRHGGMNIEQVAEKDPKAIFKLKVALDGSVDEKKLSQFLLHMGIPKSLLASTETSVRNMIRLFIDKDATQIEINPLVVTADQRRVLCLDAKLNFDDNAAFRQKDLFALKDGTQEDPREVEAAAADLNYIGLDGQIGCLVNGAGLAMATMDIIKLHGGAPANFLDVGGSATVDQVEAAMRILGSDPSVRAILVNIFGGIMRCDVIAQGILNSAKKQTIRVPVIVRLLGTKMEEAEKLISAGSVQVYSENDLDSAARRAVELSK